MSIDKVLRVLKKRYGGKNLMELMNGIAVIAKLLLYPLALIDAILFGWACWLYIKKNK